MDARAVVRVLDHQGEVVGAGFLVGRDLVATCAHVVTSAVGGDPAADDAPAGRLTVDFPLVHDPDSDQPVAATAQVHRWVPIQPDGRGDVALMRLDRAAPPGARMPPLRRVDALQGQDFLVFGFPAGRCDGVWTTGTFRGPQATRWYQMQGRPGEQRIEAGFSGSPVWDARSAAVVGMTVAADRDEETTTAYLIPVETVLGLDPDLLPCPYRGLEPFGEEHREFYFGRAREIERLADAVERNPVVAVAGPSGVGKSSLVRAGLVPLLRGEGVRVAECRPSPGVSAAITLAAALIAADPVAERELAEWLRGPQPSALETGVVAALAGGALLFVDQFEELVAADPGTARDLLGQCLRLVRVLPATNEGPAPLRVVLTVRWESLNQLATPEIVELIGSATVPVPSMGRTELREAIVGPAECAPGLGFANGLVERILDDAGAEPGQLPLVESLLTQLWERRDDGGFLTLAEYDAIGGVSGAVQRQAEDVLNRFADPADAARLRRLFTQLAAPEGDGQFVRRPVVVADLSVELVALLEPLVTGRLLVRSRAAGGSETVELAHQALIDHWPRLRGWLTEDQDFLTWRAELDRRRVQWEAAGRDDGALLRGTALVQALERLPPRSEDVSEPSREFVRRSQARQRREVRRWRIATAGLSALLVLAIATSVIAFQQYSNAIQQRNVAISRQVAGQVLELHDTNPALSGQLALAAYQLAHTTESRGSLLSTFAAPYATRLVGHINAVNSVAFSPDGHTVASGSTDQTVRLWNVTDPSHPTPLGRPLTGHTDPIVSVVFSPDGHTLASGSADQTVRLWDLSDLQHPTALITLTGHTNTVNSVAFSPDGHALASGSTDQTVRLWDLSDLHHPTTLNTLTGHTNTVNSVAFSPEGHTLASAGDDDTVRLWDLSDLHHPTALNTLDLRHTPGTSVAFSPDGHTLAAGGGATPAELWDLTDLHHPIARATLIAGTNGVTSVAFSPDGHTLASCGLDGTGRLWEVPGPILSEQSTSVDSVVISHDGHTLATGADDGTAQVWDLSDPRHPAALSTLTGPTNAVRSVALSPDGHILATSSLDQTVRLWDLSDPRHPTTVATLTGQPKGSVWSVAFSPDGHILATGGGDEGTMLLWDLSDFRHPAVLSTLTGHSGVPSSAAFSPDGHVLATGSFDHTVRLWDLSDVRHPATIATLTGYTGAVTSVVFSPDGHTLATSSFDHTARLWDLSDPHHPVTLSTLTEHNNIVFSVAFSPNGHILATSGFDHTVRLWDLSDLRHPTLSANLTGEAPAGFEDVSSVAFSPDGHTLATASIQGTTRLWETNVDDAATRICRITPTITKNEWDHYFPELPYRPPCPWAT